MNKEFLDGTTAEQSTKDDSLHVSPACIKPNVMRPSFFVMYDNHTFAKPVGNSILEIIADMIRLAKKEAYASICPVRIYDENNREIRSVGGFCHADSNGNIDATNWINEIMKDEVVLSFDGA